MEEIAQVYARSLFEVASSATCSTRSASSSGSSRTPCSQNRDLAIFFFSPYFSTDEKKDGLRASAITVAEPILMNFLEALIERHRMPAIFRIRRASRRCGTRATSCSPCRSRARCALDEATVRSIGQRIGQQTGNKIQLSSTVDPEILGGIVLRVGNFILDASIQKPSRPTSQASRAGLSAAHPSTGTVKEPLNADQP